MHPGLSGMRFKQMATLAAYRSKQSLLPRRIEHTHPSQMASEVALGKKISEGHLLQKRGVDILKALSRSEQFRQASRHHHIAQAHRGKQHFTQGANIDHPIRSI